MLEFELKKEDENHLAKIKVIGVGGGGGNTINSMIDSQSHGIDFIVANTDAQALALSKANHKIQLGVKSTKGLGTGANPELGKRAAEEDLSTIMEYLEDANIVFLTGGLGGGTGSGALPVIAHALKEKNILSIAIVTKPFDFEGKKRAQVALDAIELLKKEVDTLLIVPNQKLLETVDKHVSMINAFAMINGILNQSVKGIADIISKPGHINVDYADVRTIMKDMGLAVMGTGRACGQDRALQAAHAAIASPLLENMNIKGAKGVLLNISGGVNLALHEIGTAASIITQQADPNANIIVGSVIDHSLEEEVIVTVIATGFDNRPCLEMAQEIAIQPAIEQTVKPQEASSTAKPSVSEKRQTYESKNITNKSHEESHGVYKVDEMEDLDIPTFMREKELSLTSDTE